MGRRPARWYVTLYALRKWFFYNDPSTKNFWYQYSVLTVHFSPPSLPFSPSPSPSISPYPLSLFLAIAIARISLISRADIAEEFLTESFASMM